MLVPHNDSVLHKDILMMRNSPHTFHSEHHTEVVLADMLRTRAANSAVMSRLCCRRFTASGRSVFSDWRKKMGRALAFRALSFCLNCDVVASKPSSSSHSEELLS